MAKKTDKSKATSKTDADAEPGPPKTRSDMTLKELFETEDDPVIKVARLIEHPAPPEPKKRPDVLPNIRTDLSVVWAGMPAEEPSKPDRVAATVELEVLDRPLTKGAKRFRSIGSMDPFRGKK
ncbi:MAG: hypothetical protein ACI9MR_000299 [Myxococcota bacterium]|jgi:hypothetical protein